MKRRRVQIAVIFCIGIAAITGLVFGTMPLVFAADSASRTTIFEKAALYGVYRCYQENYIKTELTVDDYKTYDSIFKSKGSESLIKLPTGYTEVGDSDVSCSQLLGGYKNQFGGVFVMAEQMGQTMPAKLPPVKADGASAVTEFLTGMGYSKKDGSSGQCATFTWNAEVYDGYKEAAGTPYYQSWVRMCAPEVSDSGKILSDKMEITYGNSFENGTGSGLQVVQFESRKNSIQLDCNTEFGNTDHGECEKHEFDAGTNWQDFINSIHSDLSKNLETKDQNNAKYVYASNIIREPYGDTVGAEFYFDNASTAFNHALKYLSNGKYDNRYTLALNEEERAILLQGYLEDFYKIENLGCDLEGDQLTSVTARDNVYKARIYSDGEFKMCYIRPTQHTGDSKEDKVYGYNSAYYFDGTPMDLDSIVEKLNDMKITNLSDKNSVNGVPEISLPNTTDTPPSPTNQSNTCEKSAKSLGWIVCPVLDRAGTAVVGMYEKVVEPFLEIKSEWLGRGDDSVYSGWKIFRDVANIIFVILFLIVIISQITGIGVSNYNIKKFLPRFIMVVVLVNLSYIICQLATDLSNILGSSLQDLFEGMAEKVGAPGESSVKLYGSGGTASWFNLSAIASTLLTGVLGGAAAAGLVATWGIWLPGFLLAILGCLVGVLFFYIILGVRQAGVLILTALAPVAIVCYALPNTKTFFDKWKKMYVGVMVVYPICGILVGGGQFASALMVKAGGGTNFLFDLVAMLIQVVPFFFIPSILKSSMAAMGNIGMKIAGFGSRVGGFAVRTAGNSRFMQEKKQEWLRNNNRRRDSRLAERLKKSAEGANSDVKKYEDRLKSRGVRDLTDDKAVRQVLGKDYWSYRRAKNRAAVRNYRANQARRRYESSVMEDITAEAAARRELLAPGTVRYEKAVSGMERAERDKDDAGQLAMYQDGKVEAFDGSGTIINGDSLDSLKKEHADLLAHVADNPEDEAAASKLRAVQTLLGKMGPNGFDAMENNLGRLMKNHAQFGATNSQGVGIASSHLSRNFAGQIKANSRSLDALLTDINGGNFSKQSTFSEQTFQDGLGKRQTRFLSSYYSQRGTQSIKSENVNDLGDAYYDNLLQATRSSDLNGADLEQLLKVFGEAKAGAAAGKYSLKGEVERRIDAVMDAAYSSGEVPRGMVRSEGSRMIGAATPAGIDRIVKQVESAGSWSAMTIEQKTQYSNLVNNITDSLKQDAHTVENVRQLQNALATAKKKGIETAVSGGRVIDQVTSVDLHAFRIPRGSKQKAVMPAGWQLGAGGTWINSATGRPLSAADAVKAQQILEYNNSIDIENDKG